MIAIAASDNLTLVLFDVSNSFQTNVVSDPKRRVYVSIPTSYLEWFKTRFPNHPLAKSKNIKELVMKFLKNIQGTKYAGFEWYQFDPNW